MEKNRLEAFSDGVPAIIITIMILELGQPLGDGFEDLAPLAPTLLGYFLSFFFIAIYWVNHHITFHDIEKVDLKILWCNVVWLFVMSFIPFTTAWAGKYPLSVAPLLVYFADMALASIAFHIMYYFIFKQDSCGQKFFLDARSVTSLAVYTLAAAIGWLCPIAAYIAVAVVSFWWVLPLKKKQ